MSLLPKVLQHRSYSRLYFAGFASEFGAFVTETALMLFVFSLVDQDKSYLGITRACFLTMLTLGSLLGGPLGEKFNRKKLLIFSNSMRIPLIFSLIFIEQVWFIIAINGMIAFFTGIYNPSRQAMINELVPQKDIGQANSLFGSTMAILHLAGPFLGASLYAYFMGINQVIMLDLFAFFVGLFLLTRINYTPKKRKLAEGESVEKVLASLKTGFLYVIQRKDLRTLILNACLAGFCIGVLVPLLLPFVMEVLKQGEREYGILLSLFGLGGLLGGAISHRLCERYTSGKVIVTSFCLEPLAMLLWCQTHIVSLNYAVITLWGLLVFIRIPAQLNYISETVETRYLTRVHSLLDLAFVIPNISGGVLIALAGSHLSTLEILLGISFVFIILSLPRLFIDLKYLSYSTAPKVDRDSE